MALQKRKLPTWRDLPTGDGIPMDNANHPIQATLYLIEPLKRFLKEHGMTAGMACNAFLYYALGKQPVGPDIMIVNDGKDDEQGSWVSFSEGNLMPTLVCELMSETSENADRTTKKDRYERFGTPDYFLYDTEDQRFEGFKLENGVYVPAEKDPNGRIQCQSLPLDLGVNGKWLRWFTRDGEMVLTASELYERERQRADAAEARLRELERRLKELE